MYISDDILWSCEPCATDCRTCTDGHGGCTSCDDVSELVGHRCKEKCTQQQYRDNKARSVEYRGRGETTRPGQ